MSIYSRLEKIALRKTVKKPVEHIGSEYGGFYILSEHDWGGRGPIVYSFGVGEETSFDQEMIEKYNAEVYAFDPTPKSIQYVEREITTTKFHFAPYGIAKEDGTAKFHLPKNEDYVSGSLIEMDSLKSEAIEVPMKSFATIVKELGHSRVDILKMDVEGTEYDVLPDIMNSGIEIGQICVEIHSRLMGDGYKKTNSLIKMFKDLGWGVAAISKSGDELLIVRK